MIHIGTEPNPSACMPQASCKGGSQLWILPYSSKYFKQNKILSKDFTNEERKNERKKRRKEGKEEQICLNDVLKSDCTQISNEGSIRKCLYIEGNVTILQKASASSRRPTLADFTYYLRMVL